MYRIKYYENDIYIPGDKDFIALEPVLVREENKAGSLTFSLLQEHPYYSELEKLKFGITVFDGNEIIFRGRIIDSKQNFDNEYDFTAEGKLAALNDSPCRPHEFTGTPEELFTWFINNHNSQVGAEQKLLKGNVTVTDPNNYINRSWEETASTWSLMNSRLLDTLGGFFVVRYEDDGDYLDWLEDFEYYSSQKIEFGENLLELSMFINAAETYTACIPYGAKIVNNTYGEIDTEAAEWEEGRYYKESTDGYVMIASETEFNSIVAAGSSIYEVTSSESTDERLTVKSLNDDKDYIINEEMAAKYGIIYAPTDLVTWDDVTRPENLLSKSTAWLNNEGVMLSQTVETTALDLSKLGVDTGKIDMYHNIILKSTPHNLEASYLVRKLQIALDAPEETKVSLGSSESTLTDRTLGEKKKTDTIVQTVEKIKADYATNEKVSSSISKELSTFSSQILQTSENITMGILAGYTTTDDLEKYKQEVENTFNINEQGFAFQFAQMEEKLTELGNTVTTQNSYIRLENGEIIIGQTGENASPITTVYTNTGMEIRFNGVTVAKYTDGVMEINNAYIGNQLAFWKQFAFRKGAYIADVGYNLNLVWIGG